MTFVLIGNCHPAEAFFLSDSTVKLHCLFIDKRVCHKSGTPVFAIAVYYSPSMTRVYREFSPIPMR